MVNDPRVAATINGWAQTVQEQHAQMQAGTKPPGFWDNVEELAGNAAAFTADAVSTVANSPAFELAAGAGSVVLGLGGVTVGTAATATGVLAPLGIAMDAGSGLEIGAGVAGIGDALRRMAEGQAPIAPMQTDARRKESIREAKKRIAQENDARGTVDPRTGKKVWDAGDAHDYQETFGEVPKGKIPPFRPGQNTG